MSESYPRFPQYGVGGDHAGARRNRRAFRFSVVLVLLLTGVLWVAERYLRYDLNETQYIASLTLPDESSRVLLRNVVAREVGDGTGTPTARYVKALALVEEEGLALERFQQAYELDPNDSFHLMNFGTQLFVEGQPAPARERFREAGIQPPNNALPGYLEAAALATAGDDAERLTEAMAILARTNHGGEPILFPKPPWHASLPRDGDWYARKRRHLVDRCCAPLYRFRGYALAKADAQLDADVMQDWPTWAEEMAALGERLVGTDESGDEEIGAPQATAGVQFQLDALRLRQRLDSMAGRAPSDRLAERAVLLQQALELLGNFENQRDALVGEHRKLLVQPLMLVVNGIAILVALYVMTLIVSRLFLTGRSAWTLAHRRYALVIALLGHAVLLAILLLFIPAQHAGLTLAANLSLGLSVLWYGVMIFMLGFALVYPALALPRPAAVAAHDATPEEAAARLPEARRAWRAAYLSLYRRFVGILFGGGITVVCFWFLLFRIATAFFPTQLDLLVTGLTDLELETVRQVQGLLR